MSELILHAAHLSEAHQLRFSYLFDIAAKRWRESQADSASKSTTELWVIDAHSAPETIRHRPDTACVLLIATDDQAEALRNQWPNQIDAQLPPDYSVGRLTLALEHISLQAHGKRLRETLKNRRQYGTTATHDVQVKNADAAFLKATEVDPAAQPATESESDMAPGTRFRIKRWTQLTGSMAGQPYRQLLAALISGERTLDQLCARSPLARAEVLRMLQVLRGKSVLVEIAPTACATAAAEPAASEPQAAAPAKRTASLTQGLFRQLSRWIGQNRKTTENPA